MVGFATICEHAFTLQVYGESRIERGELEHTPEAIDQWASELPRRFQAGAWRWPLEQSRGASLFLLSKYAHLVIVSGPCQHAGSLAQEFLSVRRQERPQ